MMKLKGNGGNAISNGTALCLLVIFCSCKYHKINTSCLSFKKEVLRPFKEVIINKLDSVYGRNKSQRDAFRRVINSTCVNDSTLEIKVLTKNSVFDFIQFDRNFYIIQIRHELPQLHMKKLQ